VSNPIADPLVGRTIAQYEIAARVGGGAMGVVYKARDRKLGRDVALKFLPQQWSPDETAKLRFLREAQAASATNHPNICTIHDIETADDGQLFIVMAYYDGPTLKQRLESGPMAIEEALDIATQMADGLTRAHAQGVVHRDIKPGNVILTEDGVRILDFGLATFVDALKLTEENATFGTPAYMSPEQIRGQSADARSDVWAVGVVLYEMLAGHVPFQGAYAEAIAHAIRHEPPGPLRSQRPEVPEEVEQLVFRALHKEPKVRFSSGRELTRALRHVRGLTVPTDLRTETVHAPAPIAVTGDASRRRRKRMALAATAVTVVIAATSALVWWLWPVPRVSIAISPLSNQTGDPTLDPYRLALTHTIERGLGASESLRVIPHPRLIQLIRRFLIDKVDISSTEAIQAISRNSGAAIVVVPSLVYENGSMRARAEFINPSTATALAPPFETPPTSSLLTKDSAFELMDALAAGIDQRFENRRWSFREHVLPPARFRTSEAGRAFEEGITAFEEFEYAAARAAFTVAAREDANHPLPAAWLSRVTRTLGEADASEKAGAQALSLLTDATPPPDRLLVQAIGAESRRDADLAGARYRELAETYPDEPAWLMELAAYMDRRSDTASAIENYHKVLANDPGLARPHLQLCRLYNSTRSNQAGLARQHGELARAAYAALGALGGEGQSLLCLVDVLRLGDASQRLEARRAADQSLRIYERLQWPYNLARSYHYAAMAANKDDTLSATAFWEKSLVAARQVGNGALEATVLINLGVAHHELGNYALALDYYEQSFALNEKRADSRSAAYSRANAGALMVQSGANPEIGRRYLETGLKEFTGVDTNFEVFCRQNLAEYYRHSGQFELADRELNRALDLARRHGFVDDIPSLILDQAYLHVAMGKYVEARAEFRQALVGDAGSKPEMRIGLALLESRIGNVESARQTLALAREDAERDATGNLAPTVHAAFGMLAYRSGRFADARKEFSRALALKKDPLPDEVMVEARAYGGLIDSQQGRAADGRRAIEACVDQARKMVRTSLEAKCRVFLARVNLSEGRTDDAERALSGIALNVIGPEVRADVQHWRGRVFTARGNADEAERSRHEARQQLGAIRDSLSEQERAGFTARADVREILD
jgi:tetratricopeptide (TPR) repeat protein/tRNA A-37 threonylcarbamoyl transferase component Bud32